jgi:hypothetical protein
MLCLSNFLDVKNQELLCGIAEYADMPKIVSISTIDINILLTNNKFDLTKIDKNPNWTLEYINGIKYDNMLCFVISNYYYKRVDCWYQKLIVVDMNNNNILMSKDLHMFGSIRYIFSNEDMSKVGFLSNEYRGSISERIYTMYVSPQLNKEKYAYYHHGICELILPKGKIENIVFDGDNVVFTTEDDSLLLIKDDWYLR